MTRLSRYVLLLALGTLPVVRMSAQSPRSEEHTSELQSLTNLVCRLLLEKKKKNNISIYVRIAHPRRQARTNAPSAQKKCTRTSGITRCSTTTKPPRRNWHTAFSTRYSHS